MAKKKKAKGGAGVPPLRGPTPFELRVRIVREVLRGTHQADVAAAFGLSVAAVQKYMKLYRSGGLDALRPTPRGGAAPGKRTASDASRSDARREAVVEARREHPEWGTRRIRDVLARFEGLGVPESVVRRILHEEGLIDERTPSPARSHPVRRFERAAPNQLWQSDIFTFLLRRHERLYVAAFMDDHSRYVVAYALAHHQKSSLVLEAFERGVASYGAPEEVLTDQGRQYTAWRGQTAFEELLRQHGIRHVKSRPQHPQTLGKIERFWKTLWEELLSRTVFADFADCDRRLGLYLQHYNFQRPHQALGGLVPADRFFRAAPQVRAVVEAQVAANALRLARSQPPRKPFYLVGRLGDQDLSIAAQAGRLEVQVNGAAQTIDLMREVHDGTQEGRPPVAADAALADRTDGSRPGGAAPLPDGAERPVGREASDDGGRGAGDLARPLLPARDPGAGGDAAIAGAGLGHGGLAGRRDDGEADRGARGEGLEARAGEAAGGAPLVPYAAGPAGRAGQDGGGAAAVGDEDASVLDADWLARFAAVAGEEDPGRDERDAFDADEGWRGRVVSWERKLAGADAPWEGGEVDGEEGDGATEASWRETELSRGTDGAGGSERSLRGGECGDREVDDDERGCASPRDRAAQPPDTGAPGRGGDDRHDDAAAEWPVAALEPRGRVREASGGGGEGQRDADRAAPHDGPAAGRGGRGDPGAAAAEPGSLDALLAELDAYLDGRRARASDADDDASAGGDDA